MDSVSSSIVGHHTQRTKSRERGFGGRHALGQVTHRAIYLVPAISPRRVSPGECVKVQQVVSARRRGRLGREIPPRQKRRPALGIVPRKRSPQSALRGSHARRPRRPQRTGAARCSGCRCEDHPPLRANSPRSCPLSPRMEGARTPEHPQARSLDGGTEPAISTERCSAKAQKLARELAAERVSVHQAKLEGWTSSIWAWASPRAS